MPVSVGSVTLRGCRKTLELVFVYVKSLGLKRRDVINSFITVVERSFND